uniref:adenine phosphoribosyltransferase n=1 Tax=Falco tinnunculus TaxID=100819 RepID=A0A8C4UN42_FALTI
MPWASSWVSRDTGVLRVPIPAGPDGACLPPGAAAAAVLQKGFLAIRKAGHLCVQTLAQPYTDYSGREKVMEVRTDAISLGLRILLVDQWVETGGTMRAAIQLVEQQGGVVAGRKRPTRAPQGAPMGVVEPPSPYPPAVSTEPPLCPRRCRRHLHRGQRGRAVDPGALQVCPLRPPTPAAPLQQPPAQLGLTGGWGGGILHVPCIPPQGAGLLALQGRDTQGTHRQVWLPPYPRQ